MNTWDEAHALEWRRSFGPPARPTAGEFKIYKRELGRLGKTSKVLLLGSTPEIRDIASELKLELAVIDFNEKNYKESQALMKSDPKTETFVKKNWLEMDFKAEFDFVICDNILSVLAPTEAKKVIDNVCNALKPSGRWVTRVMLYNLGEDFTSPDTLNGRISKCATKREIYERLYVPLLAYYKNEIGAVIGSETYKKIKRDSEKGLFPPVCIEIFHALSYYEEENYLVQRDDFEQYMSDKFAIVRAIDDTEPFSGNWVIYVLGKK